MNRQGSRSTWSPGGSHGQHARSVGAFLRAVAIAAAGAVSAASDVHTNTQTNAAAERNAARGNPLLELLEFEIQVLHIGSPPFALGWPPPVPVGRRDWGRPAAKRTSSRPQSRRPGTLGGLPKRSMAWEGARPMPAVPPLVSR